MHSRIEAALDANYRTARGTLVVQLNGGRVVSFTGEEARLLRSVIVGSTLRELVASAQADVAEVHTWVEKWIELGVAEGNIP